MPRVLVIENHDAIREFIVQLLKQMDIEVEAVAYKISREPADLLDMYKPDAVVVRIREHPSLGLSLIRKLIAGHPTATIVGLLADYDNNVLKALQNMGAKGGLIILPTMAQLLLQIIETGQPIWASKL